MVTVFGKNFRAFIENSGMRQQDVADALGITLTALSGWLNRGTQPRAAMFEKIKEVYGLTDDDLFSERSGLYAKIHGLTEAPAGTIAPSHSKPAFLPLMGRVHAGEPQDPDVMEGVVELPDSVAKNHPRGYFLEVEGDCMNLVYPEGCLILIDPEQQPADGSVAAVAIDGADYVMRRLKRGSSSMMLCPESTNPEHRDIIISEGDGRTVSLVGTVVWYQPAKEME